MHVTRLRKHGDPSFAGFRGAKGSDNSQWKDDASYSAIHHRTIRARGKASGYTCPCGRQATEWAYDHSDPSEITDTKTGLTYFG